VWRLRGRGYRSHFKHGRTASACFFSRRCKEVAFPQCLRMQHHGHLEDHHRAALGCAGTFLPSDLRCCNPPSILSKMLLLTVIPACVTSDSGAF
jgi:hypothetical protein